MAFQNQKGVTRHPQGTRHPSRSEKDWNRGLPAVEPFADVQKSLALDPPTPRTVGESVSGAPAEHTHRRALSSQWSTAITLPLHAARNGRVSGREAPSSSGAADRHHWRLRPEFVR